MRHSLRIRRASDRAFRVYSLGLQLAEECAAEGAFEQGIGPMTLAEIADDLHLPIATLTRAGTELFALGLWLRREDGCIVVRGFAEKTAPKDARAAQRVRDHRERKRQEREAIRNAVTESVTRNGVTPLQPLHVTDRLEDFKTQDRETPTVPSEPTATGKSPKRVRPIVQPGPTFGELEPDVTAFFAVVAAANKSGTVAASRLDNLRRELLPIETQYGREALAYGLTEATSRGKASIGYIKACAKNYTGPSLIDHEPEHTLTPYDDLPPEAFL